jgi:hypothetical protein
MRTPLRRAGFAMLGFGIGLCPIQDASASWIATATFTMSTGTVNTTDSILVFVTLAVDPPSDPIITEVNRKVISGYSISDG